MQLRLKRIFHRRTGFATLDQLLDRLRANKPELLKVLDRPEVRLHTNGFENDIRCQVAQHKVSAGTRSDRGRTYKTICYRFHPATAPCGRSDGRATHTDG